VSDEHYCPWCNAPFLCFNGVNTRHFKCGSSAQIPSVACKYASQLQERIKQLEEENDALIADLLLWRDTTDAMYSKAGIGFTTEDKP
jgi:hypothetical protein